MWYLIASTGSGSASGTCLLFPGLDQRHENVEAVALRRVALRAHQALDLLERAAMVALGSDRSNIHGVTSRIDWA
jgi:hypothetical protein